MRDGLLGKKRSIPRWLPVVFLAALAALAPTRAAQGAEFADDFSAPPKSDWRITDIGELGQGEFTGQDITTSAAAENGVLTLISGGDGSFDRVEEDAFGFMHLTVPGDWQATLKVTQVGERRVRVGLMARASTDPDSPSAFLALQRLGGLLFGARTEAGAVPLVYRTGELDVKTPVWLRLVRRGALFEAYVSYDGTHWVQEPGALLNPALASGDLLVGIAVSSQIGDSYGFARLDEFSLTDAPAPPPDSINATAAVSDPEGNPVNGAWVALLDSDGKQVGGGRTLFDGTAVLPLVRPGTYTAAVSAPGYQTLSQENVSVGDTGAIALEGLTPAESVSLASEDLPASSPGWQLLVPAEIHVDLSTPDAPETGFKPVTVPGSWVDQEFTADPYVWAWYRLRLTLPEALQGRDLQLTGFNADDSDWTYWDGHLLGTRQADAGFLRTYTVPSAWTQGADHVLAIRVFNRTGGAGITSAAPQLRPLADQGSITGRVTDAAGQPAAQSPVRLLSASAEMEPTDRFALTGPDGVFGFAGLGPGSYRVVLDQVTTAPAQEVTLTAAAPEQVVDFDRQGAPSVLMVQENGFNWMIKPGAPHPAEDIVNLQEILQNEVGDFSAVDADESGFQPLEISGKNVGYQASEPGDGMWAWFRLHFTIPEAWRTAHRGDLRMWGWQFDDVDRTYLNGQIVGQTGSFLEDPLSFIDAFNSFRDYRLPADVINWEGDNVLALRAFVGGNGVGWSRGTLPILSATVSGAAPPPMSGDVDQNGRVEILDVVTALRALAGLLELNDQQRAAADVNGDGNATITDVVALLRRIAGLG